MPRYKFPNGNEMDLSDEAAALYPDLEKVADESFEEAREREARAERQRIAEAVAAKVELEDDVAPALSEAERAALADPADGSQV